MHAHGTWSSSGRQATARTFEEGLLDKWASQKERQGRSVEVVTEATIQ